jgi:hypothetical protein
MYVSVLRRATLLALASLIVLTAAVPVAAGSRKQKTEPTRQEKYRVGRVFTPSTDVVSVSGYAAWMIDEALGATTPLPRLGSAFLEAERRYGLNARYFVAHALLESGWGTSDIARLKRNLFGYNAFDRNPWKHASSFRTYEDGVMSVAKRIRTSYLTPGGRFFYRFTTLRAMNMYYASDVRWADKIAHIANVIDGLVVTLRERGLRFGTATLRGSARAGGRASVDVPWSARSGAVLPPRLRFAVRWTPLELMEAGARAPSKVPASRWTLVARRDGPGRVARLAARVPAQPGLWRLDVEARDSDGRPLPRTDRPAIRSLTARVTAAQEVTLRLGVDRDGRLAATIRNVGTRSLAAVRARTATAIEAWAMPLDPARPAHRLAARQLGSPLAAGASRIVRFAAPREPAVVVVRVVGASAAIGRATPVAALVERGRGRKVELVALRVASPGDDTLLGRKPAAGPISLAERSDPGAVQASVEPDGGTLALTSEISTVELAPGARSLLVRSLAAEPGRLAAPSSALVSLPVDQGGALEVGASGLAAGVRLVMAAIVPPDGGSIEVSTLRLAWIRVAALPDPAAAPD